MRKRFDIIISTPYNPRLLWPGGRMAYAADCKSVYAGSIPTPASIYQIEQINCTIICLIIVNSKFVPYSIFIFSSFASANSYRVFIYLIPLNKVNSLFLRGS